MGKRAYVFGTECFLAHPVIRGAWVRTDLCVLLVACPFCNAARGELCANPKERYPTATTHVRRRQVAGDARTRRMVVITDGQLLELDDSEPADG